MSADPDHRAPPAQEARNGGQYHVDAEGALGVQVGEGNTQIIYAYGRQTWADELAPPPLATVSGVVESPYRGLGTRSRNAMRRSSSAARRRPRRCWRGCPGR